MKHSITSALLAATLTTSLHSAHAVEPGRPGKMVKFPEEMQRYNGSPVALRFTNPTNGSVVHGPDVDIHFRLYSAAPELDSEARELSFSEVKKLADVDTMCFRLHGFGTEADVCSPLRRTKVTIKNALPAKWHEVSASILLNSSTGATWEISSDSVFVFVSLGGYNLLDMCGDSACLDTTDLRSAYFDYIYRHPKWAGAPIPAKSGSAIASSASIRSALAEVIQDFDIRSMLDASCGAATWINLVQGIEKVRYTGADISPKVIEENRIHFDGSSRGSVFDGVDPELNAAAVDALKRGRGLRDPVFVAVDLVEELPASLDGRPFDLVFVRDLMLHLPARHNLRVLRNIHASGARFLMASTFVEADENHASESFVPSVGHSINLSLPPYCLPEPLALVKDHSHERSDLRMVLWELHPDRPLAHNGDCSKIASA